MTDRAMRVGAFKAGGVREGSGLLPACLEAFIGPAHLVRGIEAYVAALDLAALGFVHAEHVAGGPGQPAFDPADLLKLYLYGYLRQVRSSRRLEREAACNLELIWLLRGLVPGLRTIAAFRGANAGALAAACRDFVQVLRGLELVGGAVVAIDGAFFHGNASKASISTRTRLDARRTRLEREIAAHEAALAEADAAEAETDAAEPAEQAGAGQDTAKPEDAAQAVEQVGVQAADAAKLEALRAQHASVQADLAALDASGQTQLSSTDPDARLLAKSGTSLAGYNAQIAVDGQHKLIVAAEVVNDGNDTGQLHPMALAAQQALGAQALQVAADCGYYDGQAIRACEADGIEPFVPEPARGVRARGTHASGRFGLERFRYDAGSDSYGCPAGQTLTRWPAPKTDASGKRRLRYGASKAACRACPLRAQCLGAAAGRRVIERWEHEDVIERHRARMAQLVMAQPATASTPAGPQTLGEQMMRWRKALAEHPFGTTKCRAGYQHFLVRGFTKVRGEWGLMVLCYNLARVLALVGLDKLRTYLDRRRRSARHLAPAATPWTRMGRLWSRLGRIWTQTAQIRPAHAALAA